MAGVVVMPRRNNIWGSVIQQGVGELLGGAINGMFQRDNAARQYELDTRAADEAVVRAANAENDAFRRRFDTYLPEYEGRYGVERGNDAGNFDALNAASVLFGTEHGQNANNAFKAVIPEMLNQSVNLGGEAITQAINPMTGAAQETSRNQVTLAPNDILQAQTSRANAGTAAGATMRGQDLAHQRWQQEFGTGNQQWQQTFDSAQKQQEFANQLAIAEALAGAAGGGQKPMSVGDSIKIAELQQLYPDMDINAVLGMAGYGGIPTGQPAGPVNPPEPYTPPAPVAVPEPQIIYGGEYLGPNMPTEQTAEMATQRPGILNGYKGGGLDAPIQLDEIKEQILNTPQAGNTYDLARETLAKGSLSPEAKAWLENYVKGY